MKEMNYKTKKEPIEIAIVGVGGIGSNLCRVLIPALSQGRLSESLGVIRLSLLDSDEVDAGNLPHQSFHTIELIKPVLSREHLKGHQGLSPAP